MNFFTSKKIITLITTFLLCFVMFSEVSAKNVLYGTDKDCQFIAKGDYKPFSDINQGFPVFGRLMDTQNRCINVSTKVDDMFAYGFNVFLGLVSLIAVVQVSVAGIQWMMQDTGANALGKSTAKQKLTNSIIGLVLALSSWLILNTVNPQILNANLNFGVGGGGGPLDAFINQGIRDANIKDIGKGGESLGGSGSAGGAGGAGAGTQMGDNPSNSISPGTRDATGAIIPSSAPTIFGYRDGDGTVGSTGDNGLGGSAVSPVTGWTYYNGGAHNPNGNPNNYSQGVALPLNTLIRDFGSKENIKNGAYEIFKNGVSVGAFPVVDVSKEKLDFSYGLVVNHFDSTVKNSNTWDNTKYNITYKPVADYWINNPRPAQPMVKIGSFGDREPVASEVDAVAQDPNQFGYK